MKNGKQRKVERSVERSELPKNAVLVSKELILNPSWSPIDWYERGYYLDSPFTCVDCGVDEVWTATQQKWWYEVAKGYVYSHAKRCRACRRAKRETKTEARRVTRRPTVSTPRGGEPG
jgi:hypothetical protein